MDCQQEGHLADQALQAAVVVASPLREPSASSGMWSGAPASSNPNGSSLRPLAEGNRSGYDGTTLVTLNSGDGKDGHHRETEQAANHEKNTVPEDKREEAKVIALFWYHEPMELREHNPNLDNELRRTSSMPPPVSRSRAQTTQGNENMKKRKESPDCSIRTPDEPRLAPSSSTRAGCGLSSHELPGSPYRAR